MSPVCERELGSYEGERSGNVGERPGSRSRYDRARTRATCGDLRGAAAAMSARAVALAEGPARDARRVAVRGVILVQ
jgi:hypothetical protein